MPHKPSTATAHQPKFRQLQRRLKSFRSGHHRALTKAERTALRTLGLMPEPLQPNGVSGPARQLPASFTLAGGKFSAAPTTLRILCHLTYGPGPGPTAPTVLPLRHPHQGQRQPPRPPSAISPCLRHRSSTLPTIGTKVVATKGKYKKESYSQQNVDLVKHQVRMASASNPQLTLQAKKAPTHTLKYVPATALATQTQLDGVTGTQQVNLGKQVPPPLPR